MDCDSAPSLSDFARMQQIPAGSEQKISPSQQISARTEQKRASDHQTTASPRQKAASCRENCIPREPRSARGLSQVAPAKLPEVPRSVMACFLAGPRRPRSRARSWTSEATAAPRESRATAAAGEALRDFIVNSRLSARALNRSSTGRKHLEKLQRIGRLRHVELTDALQVHRLLDGGNGCDEEFERNVLMRANEARGAHVRDLEIRDDAGDVVELDAKLRGQLLAYTAI
jgi:hypothetical protein